MKALVLEDTQKCIVTDVPDPTPENDGIIIKVMANGVCRSDWQIWMSEVKAPMILGHEYCGIVEEAGKDVSRFKKGDRVVIPFTSSEGTCPYCVSGQSHLCDSRGAPGKSPLKSGGFAEYASIRYADRNAVHLPEEISFRDAAALGCRFMTAFHGVVDRVNVLPGEWVAVYGCGGVGLSVINVATVMGANVIGIDINEANLALAKEMGAQHIINSQSVNPVEAIMEITKGGADVSVDALGIEQTMVSSVLSLKKNGRHLQVGFPKGNVSLPARDMLLREIQFISSVGMPAHRFPSMLPLISQGRLTPGKMVNSDTSLSEVSGIFERMSKYAVTGTYVVTKFQ